MDIRQIRMRRDFDCHKRGTIIRLHVTGCERLIKEGIAEYVTEQVIPEEPSRGADTDSAERISDYRR